MVWLGRGGWICSSSDPETSARFKKQKNCLTRTCRWSWCRWRLSLGKQTLMTTETTERTFQRSAVIKSSPPTSAYFITFETVLPKLLMNPETKRDSRGLFLITSYLHVCGCGDTAGNKKVLPVLTYWRYQDVSISNWCHAGIVELCP